MKNRIKKAVARTLLIAYSLFLLKPVMPVLMDKLAHTFWENVHVAVVHKINGKEHVHYELRKAAADSEKEKSGLKFHPSADDDAYSLPIAVNNVRQALLPLPVVKPLGNYLRSHTDADVALESPPPKAA